MKILLINHYAGSSEHGMEFRPYNFAKEWLKIGHDVKIVSASYSHLRRKNEEFSGLSKNYVIGGVNYFWIKTNKYTGNGLARGLSMLSFVSQIILFYKSITKGFKPDVVIASSTYPLDIYAAEFIAKKYGAKLLFEVHDIWPLTPKELGNLSENHPFIKSLQFAEDRAYRVSDVVVSMLPCAKEHMVGRGMVASKFKHVPNGISLPDWSTKAFVPSEHRTVLNDLKNNNKFIFGYAGGHAISNALDVVIKAAKRINADDIAIVLVGDGVEKDNLQSLAKLLKVANVHFLPSVSKSQIPDLLSYFDACLISWNKSPLYRFGVSPNKVFDYMMAKKPIVQALDAGNDIVKDASCGISIEPLDDSAMAEAFTKMAKMAPQTLNFMGENGYGYVTNNHDVAKLAKYFESLMK